MDRRVHGNTRAAVTWVWKLLLALLTIAGLVAGILGLMAVVGSFNQPEGSDGFGLVFGAPVAVMGFVSAAAGMGVLNLARSNPRAAALLSAVWALPLVAYGLQADRLEFAGLGILWLALCLALPTAVKRSNSP